MAIEMCVDIVNHVIADRGLRVPATYAEAFEVLGEAGLLGAARRDAMIRMSKFRKRWADDLAQREGRSR
jgi:uncharacterized protein YutE (UPF0331/DUF86 family)